MWKCKRNLKSTLLSERSESARIHTICDAEYMAMWNRQNHEPIKRSLGLKDLGVEGGINK